MSDKGYSGALHSRSLVKNTVPRKVIRARFIREKKKCPEKGYSGAFHSRSFEYSSVPHVLARILRNEERVHEVLNIPFLTYSIVRTGCVSLPLVELFTDEFSCRKKKTVTLMFKEFSSGMFYLSRSLVMCEI